MGPSYFTKRLFSTYIPLLGFLLLSSIILSQPANKNTKALGRVTVEDFGKAGAGPFDPAASRGVFIGINEFTSDFGNKPGDLKSCVNDAVDLAAAFCNLGLIEPTGVTLILSGKPGKVDSIQNFEKLVAGGATVSTSANRDYIDYAVSKTTGEVTDEGIYFLTWSSHGFEAGGVQYLAPASMYYTSDKPSNHELRGRAISEAMLNDTIKNRGVKRAIVIFDACRESKQMAPGMPELISAAKGMVTLYAVTSGKLAIDGNKNGQFTEKVLGALTAETPPENLKGSTQGYVTVRTLMDYLGTAGRYEDAEILNMPLCRHPGLYLHAERSREVIESYKQAKLIDINASRNRRYLSHISVSDVELALESPVGPELADEIKYYLNTPEKQKNYRNRNSFADAYEDLTSAPLPPTPTPRPTPVLSDSSDMSDASDNLAAIPSEDVDDNSIQSTTDLTSVAPKPGKPGIELIGKPKKSLSRLEAAEGVLFSWRATGQAYGAKYIYRINDREPVKDFRRSSVVLRNLEPGQSHTFQVMAVTRSAQSEPAVYTFEVRGNEPPTARFVQAPSANETVVAKSLRVKIDGDDSDGIIQRFLLALDDPNDPQLMFENSTGEFLLKDDILGDAPHRLIAQVIDDSGAESPPITRDFVFCLKTDDRTVRRWNWVHPEWSKKVMAEIDKGIICVGGGIKPFYVNTDVNVLIASGVVPVWWEVYENKKILRVSIDELICTRNYDVLRSVICSSSERKLHNRKAEQVLRLILTSRSSQEVEKAFKDWFSRKITYVDTSRAIWYYSYTGDEIATREIIEGFAGEADSSWEYYHTAKVYKILLGDTEKAKEFLRKIEEEENKFPAVKGWMVLFQDHNTSTRIINSLSKTLDKINAAEGQMHLFNNKQAARQLLMEVEPLAQETREWCSAARKWMELFGDEKQARHCLSKGRSKAEDAYDWNNLASVWSDCFDDDAEVKKCLLEGEAVARNFFHWNGLLKSWNEILHDEQAVSRCLKNADNSADSTLEYCFLTRDLYFLLGEKDKAREFLGKGESVADGTLDWCFLMESWLDLFENKSEAIRCFSNAKSLAKSDLDHKNIAEYQSYLSSDIQ